MTLIIGIKCKDGVVVGADSAATLVTATGQRTSMQPTEKLDIISDSIILGVSGPVGLAQLFKSEIEEIWNNKKLSGKKPYEAMVILREALWKHLSREYKIAKDASQTIGRLAIDSIITQTLIALPISKSPCLFEFNQQGSPEEKNEKLPTVAIGSGQPIVDPFLAFIRQIFWPKRLPSLAEGVFAIFWALDYGIRSAPGGIADPKQIVVLENVGGKWQTRQLADNELFEHRDAVNAAEKHLGEFRSQFKEKSEEEIKSVAFPESNPNEEI